MVERTRYPEPQSDEGKLADLDDLVLIFAAITVGAAIILRLLGVPW